MLAAASVLGFSEQQKKSRESRRLTDVSTVGIAINTFYLANSSYPLQTNNPVNDPQDGTKLPDTGLTELVKQGLINSLPSDPRPATSGPELLCTNYTYARVWDNHNNQTIDGVKIVNRHWVLYFRSEYTGTNGHHPQESTVFLTTGASWCTPKSAYGIFLGPAK